MTCSYHTKVTNDQYSNNHDCIEIFTSGPIFTFGPFGHLRGTSSMSDIQNVILSITDLKILLYDLQTRERQK